MRSIGHRCGFALALLIGLLAPVVSSRADTVASLLGNFTINQFSGLQIGSRRIDVHYVVVFGQLPALRELHVADSDGDGVTTQAERDAYVAGLTSEFAEHLRMRVDGAAVPLRATRWTSSLPSEQAGFSLRLEADFSGAFARKAGAARRLDFDNDNYSGRIGWHEVQVRSVDGVRLFDSSAFGNSLTEGLSVNPKTLPADGPLDERSAQLSFVRGALPANAVPQPSRPGTRATNPATATTATAQTPSAAPQHADDASPSMLSPAWLAQQTKRLLDLISGPNVPLSVLLLALLAALLLGALHAFSPGHGKTVVGAYLIGSRGTPRHAAFLGLTVTVTHTLGVFLLGFATLFAAQYVVPERLFPILSLLSGAMVVAIGLTLFVQRSRAWRAGRSAAHPHDHDHAHDHDHMHGHAHDEHRHAYPQWLPLPAEGRVVALASPATAMTAHHAHAHHGGVHGHAHGTDASVHSHGGSMHSHLPPGTRGEPITWRGLLALGISGGLVPCPSAMVLLLAAVALHKTAYGLFLVLAFSFGLAVTLTLVGLAFLYARNLFPRIESDGPWSRALPIVSAGVVTLVGLAICYGAVVSNASG